MPRVMQPELLDGASAEEAAGNLRDLDRINRWFGGNAILARKLAPLLARKPDALILDVGAAGGDTIRYLARRFPRARFIALDRSEMLLRQAGGRRVLADACAWPIARGSVDIVICTLFLHHLGEAEVVRAVEDFRSAARMAVVAVDLQRHVLARQFLPATRWLFRWDPITLHDGPISVDAAFTKAELRQLVPEARVESHAPWFRLSLVIESGGKKSVDR
ncbi:MAG: methyltransferase domain-containing protein [Acidobacteria bacterium]|nr:methyltransferase domain-containing protein [Acidobacteriota bacterium]